jgi:hypothetical protein
MEANRNIGVLPQFDRLVQPLGKLERIRLKEDILDNPDERVIHTWRGKHLLDRERYELCRELNLSVTISEQFFEDWMDAAEYICRKQLDEYELTDKYQKYLIGQLLHYCLARNGDQDRAEKKTDISEVLGQKWNVCGATVSKYGFFSDAINDIYAQSEELARLLLSDKISVSHENVVELSRLRGEEIQAVAKAIETENVSKITRSFIRNEVKLCHIQERGAVSRKEKQEMNEAKNAGIRKMPVYDPDSGVNSLCMTIESWISSIQRVRHSDDFEKISEKASLHLMKKLSALEYVINTTQESLVERTKL